MLRIGLFALALLAMTGASNAGFLHYDEPEPPVGGDCGAIAAAIGPEETWRGEFSGTKIDDFRDNRYPYSARGCFKSEYACRVWQHQALDYLGRGYLNAMSCRQGIRGF